ncbi:DUF2778 domain-containing protein [Bordetella sp. 2513F-2]
MTYDMHYDGQVLAWNGHGKFRASSGLPDHQSPEHFCVRDFGPIPEGLYRVLLTDRGTAQDDGRGVCNLSAAWGMQTIPRGAAAGDCEPYWANWGYNRARMEPADAATRNRCAPIRGGFYLHDSSKGYSHGCIEVEGRIFPLLRTYVRTYRRDSLIVKVEYVPGRSTNGGTHVQ